MISVILITEGVPTAAIPTECQHIASAIADSWMRQLHIMQLNGQAAFITANPIRLDPELCEAGIRYLDVHEADVMARHAAAEGAN